MYTDRAMSLVGLKLPHEPIFWTSHRRSVRFRLPDSLQAGMCSNDQSADGPL